MRVCQKPDRKGGQAKKGELETTQIHIQERCDLVDDLFVGSVGRRRLDCVERLAGPLPIMKSRRSRVSFDLQETDEDSLINASLALRTSYRHRARFPEAVRFIG